MDWPDRKSIAFTVVDYTNYGTVSNLRPVYDVLYECGLKTTTTVWVYSLRDADIGESLMDDDYKKMLLNCIKKV